MNSYINNVCSLIAFEDGKNIPLLSILSKIPAQVSLKMGLYEYTTLN